MQESDLQVEYGISLNSSPCADFLSSDIDRGDSQGSEYGGIMGEMSAPYGDVKDTDMNIFDKPLGMDDFSIDLRSEFYQTLGSELKLSNGDEASSCESIDEAQNSIDLLQSRSNGPKTKKIKYSLKDSVKGQKTPNLRSNNKSVIEVVSPTSKVHSSSNRKRCIGKVHHSPRKSSRPLKNSNSKPSNPKVSGGIVYTIDGNSYTPGNIQGPPSPMQSDNVSDIQRIDNTNNEGDDDDEQQQNVVVRMEPALNLNNELSLDNVQAIREELSNLNPEISSGERNFTVQGESKEIVLESDDLTSVDSYLGSPSLVNPTRVTFVQSPSSAESVVSTNVSNEAEASTSGTVSDRPIILNANVLNQGSERNVSYVMIPVSLVQQIQGTQKTTFTTASSTCSTATTSRAVLRQPQYVQLLNDNNGYVCHVCGYSGKMPYLLENHMKTCHLPHRPYICLGCYKAFNLRGTALCHIRLKHPHAGTQMMIDQDMEGLQTVECQKLMQHIYRCHVCDSVGKYMSGVNNKPKNLNPNLFVCKLHADLSSNSASA